MTTPGVTVSVDLLLTVEAERGDKSKRLVAVLRQSKGRTLVERADEKIKPDCMRWAHQGLIEPVEVSGKKTQRHTKPGDPALFSRLRDLLAKHGLIGTITQGPTPVVPREPTFQDEIAEMMDVYVATTAAVLFMDCTPGDIVKRKAGTLHVKTARTPCRGCMEILDIMTKREAKAWPDARLRKRKCQHCNDWHWIYVDEHSVGVMQRAENIEGHEGCIALFTYTAKELRYALTPDTCVACAEALPKLGKITSIIMGETWPIERGG